MTQEDIDVTEMRFPDTLAALANASVDAALPTDPFVTGAVSRGLPAPTADTYPSSVGGWCLAAARGREVSRFIT
jgi:ABC-type nitrate/sulfonate/bicarbonate transport system substrate-binding protein